MSDGQEEFRKWEQAVDERFAKVFPVVLAIGVAGLSFVFGVILALS